MFSTTHNRGFRQFRQAFIVAGSISVAFVGSAGAASPLSTPVSGSVTCTLSATSTFSPYLGYAPGILGRRIGPNAKSTWKLQGTLTNCSGSQSGGHPSAPLPIDHGDIKIVARATSHACADVAANGLDIRAIRVLWFNSAGTRLGTTRVVDGSVAVANVGATVPPFPPVPPSGPPTFSGSGTAIAGSNVFPAEHVTLTGIGDPISLSLFLPCSEAGPPLTQGIPGVAFSGVNGISTVSVTP